MTQAKGLRICRQCGARAGRRLHVSRRGLCARCSEANQAAAATQIAERRGPLYEAWKDGMRQAAS